ncbi:hypothetical protein ACP70R_025415 [Stipagrostis hirtigluma subsp. patula]
MDSMEVEAVSCECCGLEEECTGEYIAGVRAYFGGRWLCGLCSEAVKYEAGKGKCAGAAAPDVEEAVRAHMAICRTLKRGGPAGRVAEGMRQMLRTASGKRAAATSSSSSSSSSTPSPSPREHHRASALSVGL